MPQRLLPNCKNCNVVIDDSNCVRTAGSRLNSCRACYNKYKRRVNTANYQKHVTEVKDYHKRYHIQRRYNIKPLEFDMRLANQLGGCAICKQPFEDENKIVIDHDHRTGIVRDLLCYRCNNALGQINDSEDLLIEMIEYLKRHGRKTA